MEFWWREIKYYSYRDQLSLSYAIWKLNLTFKIYYLPKRFMTDYLSYREHSIIVKYWNWILILKYAITSNHSILNYYISIFIMLEKKLFLEIVKYKYA